MLEAIIFDFDGVVVDSEILHHGAFVETCKGEGIDFPENFAVYQKDFIGFDDRDAFRVVLGKVPGKQASAEVETRIEGLCARKQKFFDLLLDKGELAVPGALDLIDECLAAGLPIAVGSGATQQDITGCLTRIGRVDAFKVIVAADDVTFSKPHPETYQKALDALGALHGRKFDPAACVVLEDTPAGLASARAAGLRTVGIPTSLSAEGLIGKADHILPGARHTTLSDLQAICRHLKRIQD